MSEESEVQFKVSESIPVDGGMAAPHDRPMGFPTCPVCGRESKDELTPLDALDEWLRALVSANAPAGQFVNVVCQRCVQMFERARTADSSCRRRSGSTPTTASRGAV
jgi:hypothetical protein